MALSGRARQIIKSAIGVTHVHRIRWLNVAFTANALTTHGLLTADDEPDYDVNGTDTTICECETGSRIMKIDLQMLFTLGAAADIVEWMILKDPDQMIGTSATPAQLFTMDRDTTTILLRKYVLAYGVFKSTSSKETTHTRVRIRRQAMMRAGTMLDLDRLRIHIRHTGGASSNTSTVIGRIYTRK